MNASAEESAARPYTLAVANQKGGVAKTTTTVCLSEALAHMGYRVLAIDYDGQANLTRWILGEPLARDEVSILDVLQNEQWTLANSADEAEGFGFDFVGSTEDLFNLDAILAGDELRVFALARAVRALQSEQGSRQAASNGSVNVSERPYDFCLIDCPPALGLAVSQALMASDGVLIPTTLERMPVEGLKKLTDKIQQTKASGYSDVRLVGVVPTIVHVVRNQTASIARVLSEQFGDEYLDECAIPVRTKISETSARSMPLRAYCKGKDSDEYTYYDRLAEAIAERTIGPPERLPATSPK